MACCQRTEHTGAPWLVVHTAGRSSSRAQSSALVDRGTDAALRAGNQRENRSALGSAGDR
jgi:hypothetical protein